MLVIVILCNNIMLQSRPLQIYFRIHIGSRSQALVKFEIVKVGFNKEVDEHRATERRKCPSVGVMSPILQLSCADQNKRTYYLQRQSFLASVL